ncbi:glycosyltransferase family 4 protein [Granulicella sp. dw_53]|uniref:glycosyltransferase family 4 protein n=1 Tax=Granulicella sp. dw_53 TaxID=2719792 RepID=UPI001BD5102F|nr:glycosyltransferase family 4 protein [Granulicella sp. dw_53]
MSKPQKPQSSTRPNRCHVVAIWIDWYAYHRARFAGLQEALGIKSEVAGIELVGGIGVHAGLIFREDLPPELPVETLMPKAGWHEASKIRLSVMLWHRLSALNPKIVLVPGYYTLPGITAALWAKIHSRTSVLMTESTAEDHKRSSWRESLKSAIIRSLFDWAITGGAAHVRYLIQLGFSPDRITRFYDVVDNNSLRENTLELRRLTRPKDHGLPDRYFLFIGRLASEKNVSGLLRSWFLYREQGGTWPLVLVGDGPEAQELRALAAPSAYRQDVHFLGHKSSKELIPCLSFASCFVLPSIREPWGLVVNEAMASSLPVIVSNRCGCAEDLVRHGHNGLVFNPDREIELTDCLSKIEKLSGGGLKEMGRASAAQIADYSPLSFGKEIAFILNYRHGSDEEFLTATPILVSSGLATSTRDSSNLPHGRREITP